MLLDDFVTRRARPDEKTKSYEEAPSRPAPIRLEFPAPTG